MAKYTKWLQKGHVRKASYITLSKFGIEIQSLKSNQCFAKLYSNGCKDNDAFPEMKKGNRGNPPLFCH